MKIDIRVDTSWLNHRKRYKLQELLGGEGVAALLDLWLYAAVNFPHDGVLRGHDATDIRRVCKYRGKGDIVNVLCEIGLLDQPIKNNKSFRLHNWRRHQSFLAHSRDRSLLAARAAKAKYHKRKRSAESMPSACGTLPPSPAPNPSPSPNPDLKIFPRVANASTTKSTVSTSKRGMKSVQDILSSLGKPKPETQS